MGLASTHHELDELGGGVFRHTQALKAIGYLEGGALRRIVSDYTDGDVTFPHVVTAARLKTYIAGDGMRRICPTEELDRYIEIGAPYIKPSTTWQKVNLGTPERQGNRLIWTTTQANVYAWHGGHFTKLGVLLKGGWEPPGGQFAFPVGLNGLTRDGANILRDGIAVAHLHPPVVYDYDNPLDTRQIAWQFVTVDEQTYILFTLPDISGMSRPLIDPLLTLQPDATDGKDTWIYNANHNNYGVAVQMDAGQWAGYSGGGRILIKFNLTTVPDTFDSATLSLYCLADYSENARAFRVFRQKRAWVEGTENGGTGETGADWYHYDAPQNYFWLVQGGFGAEDCEQTDIGYRNFTATETLNEFKDFPLTPTTKTGLDLSNGWLIKPDTENADAYIFATSDNATAANRPKLTIDYTLPVPIKFMHYQRRRAQ